MLDANFVTENRTLVEEGLRLKGVKDLDPIARAVAMNEERKKLTHEVDGLRHEGKELSQKIGAAMKAKAPDARGAEGVESLKVRSKEIKEREKEIAKRQTEVEDELQKVLLTLPNLPHREAVKGGPEANAVRRTW